MKENCPHKKNKKIYISYDEVKAFITKELLRKGYSVEEKITPLHGSRYYKIQSGESIVEFRVADHGGQTSLPTIRIDYQEASNRAWIRQFLNKRLFTLGCRHMKNDVFDKMEGRKK